MIKGTVQKFDKEMNEREQALLNNNKAIMILKPLTAKMPSDAFNDITIYPGYWINQGIANITTKRKSLHYHPTIVQQHQPCFLLVAREKLDRGT